MTFEEWLHEAMRQINALTPNIKNKAASVDWFLLRNHLEDGVRCLLQKREPSSDHVAWCRYVCKHEKATRIQICASDAEGAFPVYRRASEYPTDTLKGVETLYIYRYRDGTTQVRAPFIDSHASVIEMLEDGLRAMREGRRVEIT